eukprot:4195017-Pyramimonas_sp.AAC.1
MIPRISVASSQTRGTAGAAHLSVSSPSNACPHLLGIVRIVAGAPHREPELALAVGQIVQWHERSGHIPNVRANSVRGEGIYRMSEPIV